MSEKRAYEWLNTGALFKYDTKQNYVHHSVVSFCPLYSCLPIMTSKIISDQYKKFFSLSNI